MIIEFPNQVYLRRVLTQFHKGLSLPVALLGSLNSGLAVPPPTQPPTHPPTHPPLPTPPSWLFVLTSHPPAHPPGVFLPPPLGGGGFSLEGCQGIGPKVSAGPFGCIASQLLRYRSFEKQKKCNICVVCFRISLHIVFRLFFFVCVCTVCQLFTLIRYLISLFCS